VTSCCIYLLLLYGGVAAVYSCRRQLGQADGYRGSQGGVTSCCSCLLLLCRGVAAVYYLNCRRQFGLAVGCRGSQGVGG